LPFGPVRLGVGPIGWVNDDLREWGADTPTERVLAEMAAAGFEGTEMSYRFPADPAELRRELGRHGLVLSGAYRWCNLAAEAAEVRAAELEAAAAHVGFCAAAGAAAAVLAEGTGSLHWDRAGARERVRPLDAGGWRRLREGLEALGRLATGCGVRLCFHPHGGTPVETEDDIDRLCRETDPDLVALCPDTGHIRYAGGDPARVLRRHAGRVGYLHVKDVRGQVLAEVRRRGASFLEAVRLEVFCPPGAGDMDFAEVLAPLGEAGYGGWVVVEAEQNPAVHPAFDASRQARRYIGRVVGR
jgi:inosose dehydratase